MVFYIILFILYTQMFLNQMFWGLEFWNREQND